MTPKSGPLRLITFNHRQMAFYKAYEENPNAPAVVGTLDRGLRSVRMLSSHCPDYLVRDLVRLHNLSHGGSGLHMFDLNRLSTWARASLAGKVRNYWGHCCQSDCIPEALRGVHVCKFWQVPRPTRASNLPNLLHTASRILASLKSWRSLVSITFRLLGLECINTKHDCHLSCNGQHGLVQHQEVLLQGALLDEYCLKLWSWLWASQFVQTNKETKVTNNSSKTNTDTSKIWNDITYQKIHVWCLNTKNDNHKQILHECAYARIHICMRACIQSIHPSIHSRTQHTYIYI